VALVALWLIVLGSGLLLLGLPPRGVEVARGVGFLVVAIAYGGVWLAVAMLFSVVFRSTATSALCALGLWLFFFILWPMIAQVPALLATLPVIVYIWASGDYGTGAAVTYSVLLFFGGMLDNVLKPILLGRGVDAPMVVILLGALGGLATHGLLGMFVGATLLALGYQIFMWWVKTNPDTAPVQPLPSTSA